MPIQVYNTLTRRKEEFAPLDSDVVRIYVCGSRPMTKAILGMQSRPLSGMQFAASRIPRVQD